MQTFECVCGNELFFDNRSCTKCGKECGWCFVCSRVTAIVNAEPGGQGHCGNRDCGAPVSHCANRVDWDACNGYLREDDDKLCVSCTTTKRLPDLTIAPQLEGWRRLEAAKRRLLYDLELVGFAWRRRSPSLQFHFLADTADEHFPTGHADGVITINLKESDPVAREEARQQFAEPHRTLIGHLRHEVSHYVWQVGVQGQPVWEKEFCKEFGDFRSPSYADAMPEYYRTGPPADWQASFISAYATAHPWEDFAETAAFYLDMRSMLETLAWQFPQTKAKAATDPAEMVATYQALGRKLNEVNRTLGLTDVLPEVIAPPVVKKIDFVHRVIAADAAKA